MIRQMANRPPQLIPAHGSGAPLLIESMLNFEPSADLVCQKIAQDFATRPDSPLLDFILNDSAWQVTHLDKQKVSLDIQQKFSRLLQEKIQREPESSGYIYDFLAFWGGEEQFSALLKVPPSRDMPNLLALAKIKERLRREKNKSFPN